VFKALTVYRALILMSWLSMAASLPPLLTRLPRTPSLACVWNPRIHGNLFECSAGNGRSKGFQSGCFACPTRI